jgi:UTP--glucose-1-phosphate uridylyltransferase
VNVPKAVITAAGVKQRHLPLQTIVDSEARSRKTLGLLVDEAESAGIREVGIVVAPGTGDLYREATEESEARITILEQSEPRGYGHAVLSAADFVGGDSFLLMVSDHLYVSELADQSCAAQLVECAGREECPVSAVQATHESKLSYFGAVGGTPFEGRQGVFQVQSVLEKPSPTAAEQQLLTPGLRHGYYLCFFGLHVLTPAIMPLLKEGADSLAEGESLNLSDSLNKLLGRGRYLAHAIKGRRYDIDNRYGILMAQLALALEGKHREEVLAGIIELLAQ